jgi:signal transduction histidine kinase
MPRLPELLRPIVDAELPHLRKHKLRAVVALSWVIGSVQALYDLINVLRGDAALGPTALMFVVNMAVCAGAILLAPRATRPSQPDVLLLAIAVLLLVDLSATGWVTRQGRNDLFVYAPVVPLIMAMFVPCRPAYSLALLPPTLAMVLASGVQEPQLEGRSTSLVFAAVSMSIASALASQLQRRVWRKFERANAQLTAADRMSSLGRMTAGIAHELKTPLAAVMNGLESIHSLTTELRDSVGHPDVTPADLAEIAKEIGEVVVTSESGARRAAHFVSAIRAQTVQMTKTVCEPFAIRDAVTSAITLLEHLRRRSGITIDVSGVSASIGAIGDREKVAQIVSNLVRNALDACHDLPTTRITVSATESHDMITLVVEDDGVGIPEAHRARIFDPLFTTKGAEEGTGLGLAISRDIAEGAFGGTLKLAPSAKGARFELCIPHEASRVSTVSGAWAPAQAA